ncbi:MAG: class I SAM-dependent methyltransferase [Kiloniellales bacterium]
MTTARKWDPERYARNGRFVAELGEPVLELLAAKPGERILDLGCGDGALTERLARAGCRVVGVDSSPEQVAAARARGLDARVMNAAELRFEAEFDAVFSNASLHWVKDADAAIAGVRRALKPRGRFVAELGAGTNIGRIVLALERACERRDIDGRALNPWTFPTLAAYRRRLQAGGFTVDSIELFPRPTPLPGDIEGWLETFGENYLSAVPVAGRPQFIAEVREDLRADLCDAEGRWTADYVRLRFAARLPAAG